MELPSWTVDEMCAEKLYTKYPRDAIEIFFGKNKELSILKILWHPLIPDRDKIWLACRNKISYEHRFKAIEKIVTRCITKYAAKCGVLEVEKWASDWMKLHHRLLSESLRFDDIPISTFYAIQAALRFQCMIEARWDFGNHHHYLAYAEQCIREIAFSAYMTTIAVTNSVVYGDKYINCSVIDLEIGAQVKDFRDVFMNDIKK